MQKYIEYAWRRRWGRRANERSLVITEEGLVLGKSVLAGWKNGALDLDGVRARSLLFVAYRRPMAEEVFTLIRRAEKAYKRGDIVIALTHLALTGLHRIDEFDTPLRLFKAERLLKRGFTARELLKLVGLAKDDVPDDDDDDDEGDDEGEGDKGSGDGSSSGNPDFDSKHPRWPAGSPDGTGGEFRTKDGTNTGRALSDDHIDSDPIGGIVIPAAVAAGALALGGVDALITVGSRIRDVVNALSSDSSERVQTPSEPIVNVITDAKIESQMPARGWNEDSLLQTVYQPYTTRAAVNRATGNNATAYFNRDGSYVVVDDITNEVVQVSDSTNPNWIPDSSIKNAYKP